MLSILEAYKDADIITDRYTRSQRPKVKTIKTREKICLPVIRYEGLYYSGITSLIDKEYKGKFYFYETKSHYGLDMGNSLMSANKYHAMRYFENLLFGEFDEIELASKGQTPNLLSLRYLFYTADVR